MVWHGGAWLGLGVWWVSLKNPSPAGNGTKIREEMERMEQYQITLEGLTPLLMHNDNLGFNEKIKAWQKAPENKANSIAGDDRSPAWTWIGYLYHDGKNIGVSSDNIMTMLREGGAKVLTGKRTETYKKQTQSGLMLDQQQFDIMVNGNTIAISDIKPLIGETDFNKHIETAEILDFELLVKRAKIGAAKHVRVRPMFRTWTLTGSLTVLDSELTGLTEEILKTVLNQAGALCGLCDWRPSSPKASGTFGKFTPHVKRIN
jgi:hypothetical protein